MTTKEVALYYLDKLKLVPIPCMGEGDSKGKVPLIKWRDIQSLPERTTVEEWFDKFPQANIGLKTGKVSGILVLDNDGVEIADPIPLTPIASSQPGHFHYYFKNPDFYVPPSAAKIGEHLDIRCDQGFIVAPPSIHFNKQSGEIDGKYNWLPELSPKHLEFAPCPDWLITRIKQSLENNHGFDWSGALNVGIGARDDTLTRAASSLVAKGFEYPTALAILRGINSSYNPPLQDSLVVGKLTTAVEFISSRRMVEDEEKFGDLNLSNFYMDFAQNSQVSRLQYLKAPILISELKEEEQELDWIWENYIARGHLTLLSALWKAGKSTLLGALLKCMQEGIDLAGCEITPCNILIISEESEPEWVIRREKLKLSIPVYLWVKPLYSRLSQAEWENFIKDIKDFCTFQKVDLVIFDTVSKFWSIQNENDPSQMESTLLPLTLLLQKNIGVLLVHHFRKGGGDQGQASRGSGVLGSTADILLDYERVQGDPKNTQRKLTAYSRFDTEKEVVLEFDPTTGLFDLVGDLDKAKKIQRLRKMLWIVRSLVKDNFQDGVNARNIMENWSDEDGKRPGKRTIEMRLKELYEAGDLELVKTEPIKGGISKYYRATYENLDISLYRNNKIIEPEAKNSLRGVVEAKED